ncbi:MAG: gliding motility-associated ABC transporter substrate-binding protein GldG [Sphingobacteriales bacterium]|nr:MAG: gliding motility-associated ABC transporter substrate-binding protein GldG [Sphingobacteriales bacterium]
MAANPKISGTKWWLPFLIIALVAINWAASVWHSRVDLTNEKRFTLSAATKKLLKDIKEPVQVDVFLKGNFPSGFKKLAASSADLLQEFKEISGRNFQYNFIGPDEVVEGTQVPYGDTLSAMGLVPINLTSQVKEGQQQQFVYPYALVHYKGQALPVTLYQGKTPLINFQELNSAEAMLEYNIANAIAKISQPEKTMIGYANGNGEPMDFRIYDLVENNLNIDYKLSLMNINVQPFVPKEFKVLLMVKPTQPFTEEAKFKLDQYVMNGGKILMFIDRLNAEMDSLQIKNEVVAYDRGLQLNDLMFKYGVRLNTDLVMDLQCDYLPFDVNGNGQFDLLPWNYFPVLESKSNHPINKNLGFVSGRFVNSLDTVEAEGIKKTILLSSSLNARKIASPALISGKENVTAPENEKYKTANIPVAVLLEGKFTSLFANRATQAMRDSLNEYGGIFLSQNMDDNKMIIVADGDIVLNSVVKGNQPIPMGMNPYTYGTQREFPFANKDFMQNCMDYLINEGGLSEAKGKDYVARLLDPKKVEDEKTFWQLINIALPVMLVILFALVFQWNRKRKYSK